MSDDDDNDGKDDEEKESYAATEGASQSTDFKPDFEAAKLILNEWEWRHQHCWKSLQRFGLAGITIAIIPYAKADPLQTKLGVGILIFPLTAWFLCLAAAWLFTAEYTRCRPAETKYYELLGPKYKPVNRPPTDSIRSSIGRSTISIFIVGSSLLSIANAEVLIHIADLHQAIGVCTRRLTAICVLLFSLGLSYLISKWAAEEISKITNVPKTNPKENQSAISITD